MTNVQVRDVPPEIVELLKARASSRRQSLQSYLLDVLEAEAGVENNRRILEEAGRRATYKAPLGEAAELVRRAREERDSQLT
ncbi:MAG: FitA-like ribbon-helix-helix domain-containing protein [Micromonosporaceae bacterium]